MRTPHRHRELEMNVVIRGNAEYVLADQHYRLGSGLSYLLTIGWHLFVGEGKTTAQRQLHPLVSKAVNLLETFPEKDFSLSFWIASASTVPIDSVISFLLFSP